MKVAIFCCLIAFCCCLGDVENVRCESIRDYTWSVGRQKTCFMDGSTVIDSPGVSIASTADESVGALNFETNRKIKYLPKNPAKQFVNLVMYDAGVCSIETITKENFKALSKLIKLYLFDNKIEKVPSDVFEDLTALEVLYLYGNKIKYINSAAFRGLSKLTNVDLSGNVCIQGDYTNATSIATMIPTLSDKCGFSEDLFLDDFARKTSDQAGKVSESMTSNHKEQQQQANASNSLNLETLAEIKAEIVKSRVDNAIRFTNIEIELKAAKVQNGELQSVVHRHQQEKLKSQETITRQETELKLLREQNRNLNDELKVNLETMKTQMQIELNQLQGFTNQTAMNFHISEQESKKCAIAMRICESELKTVEMFRNDLRQCEIDKINFRDNFRESKAKLEVFTGIDIGEMKEKINSLYELLQNANKV